MSDAQPRDVRFGDVWKRPGLPPRDRSLADVPGGDSR